MICALWNEIPFIFLEGFIFFSRFCLSDPHILNHRKWVHLNFYQSSVICLFLILVPQRILGRYRWWYGLIIFPSRVSLWNSGLATLMLVGFT